MWMFSLERESFALLQHMCCNTKAGGDFKLATVGEPNEGLATNSGLNPDTIDTIIPPQSSNADARLAIDLAIDGLRAI